MVLHGRPKVAGVQENPKMVGREPRHSLPDLTLVALVSQSQPSGWLPTFRGNIRAGSNTTRVPSTSWLRLQGITTLLEPRPIQDDSKDPSADLSKAQSKETGISLLILRGLYWEHATAN